jgi:hypothetical protein
LNITLLQVIDIHHHLNKNDGVENHTPLPLTLNTRPRMSARLRELTEVISASKGYTSLVSDLLDSENGGDEEPASEEEDENEDSADGDGLDSDNENASDLENDVDNQEEAVNESTTERDTNSENKSPSYTDDEQDANFKPGDDATDLGDDNDDYSEDEDEYSDDPSGDTGSHEGICSPWKWFKA